MNVSETNAVITTGGQLTLSDANGALFFNPQVGTAGSYGSFSVTVDGVWTYTTSSAHNEFVGGVTYTDQFNVTAANGTMTSVTVNILGTNDAAVLRPLSGNFTESDAVIIAGGTLSITDVDSAETFIPGVTTGVYGTLTVSGSGAVTYTASSAHNEFIEGESYTEIFAVFSSDGTQTRVTIKFLGTNDAALLSSATMSLTETNEVLGTSGTLTISDVDSPATFTAQAGTAGIYGNFTIAANGAWTYTASSAHDEFVDGQTYADSFDVFSTDGTKTNVTVNILGTNDAALLSPAGGSFAEDDAVIIATGTLFITDVDSSETFIPQVTTGIYGTLTVNEGGEATYTATSAHNEFIDGQIYTDSFRVFSSDGTETSVTIEFVGTNDAALLSSATMNLTETDAALSTSGTLTISDVDSLATFVAQAGTAGIYGTFTIAANGAWTYTASSAHSEFVDGQTYTDSFDVFSADGTKTNVTVNILGANVAAVLSSATENLTETNAVLSTSGTLTIIDVDSPATFIAQAGTAGNFGTFTIGANGAWTYTASSAHDAFIDGVTFIDVFKVSAADGTVTTVTINILGTDDAAVLSSATENLTETDAVLSTWGMLSISDVDSPATFVTQTAVTGQYGSFTIAANGEWAYTSSRAHDEFAAGQIYTDSFDVFSTDGTKTDVTVKILGTNDPAVLTPGTSSLTETDAALSTSGILSISDVDSPAAFVAQTGTAGSHGTFTIASNGAWTYTASSAHNEFVDGQTYTDSFDVFSADGTKTNVTVNILGTNDAAVLTPATSNLNESDAVLSTAGTLSITDVDSPATFIAQAGTAGSHGTFTIAANGAWTYTASNAHNEFVAGQTYTDTFEVSSADGTKTNVTVNILGTNDPAMLGSATINLTETDAALSTSGALSITDVDSPATFVTQAGTVGSYGTFTIGANGAWTYTASSAHNEFVGGQTYTDSFDVFSADGTKTNVTVNILGTNDAAVLSPAISNLTETDSALSTSGTLSISDVDSPATFVAQAGTAGSYGTFTIAVNGAWTYTASSAHNDFIDGQTYTDSFEVSSADGTKTNVTVNILGTNDAAVLGSATSNLTETDAALTTSGTLSITDVDSPAAFVVQAATAEAYGTFTINEGGAWTYTASSAHDEFVGGQAYADSFDVFSADGTKTSVTVNILGTNDAAVLIPATSNLVETDAVLSTSGTLSITDVDSPSTFVAQAATAGAYGTFTIDESGAWTYTASSAHDEFVGGQVYAESFDVFSADGTKTNVTVNIVGSNDAAILSSANVVVPETNAVITTGGVLTISDVDSPSAFQAQVGTAGSFGRFTIDAAGVWSYTTYTPLNELPADVIISESFVVRAADGTRTTVTVTVPGTDDVAIANTDVFVTDEATAVSGNVFFGNSITGDFDPDSPLVVGTVNGSATNVGQQIQLASGALLTVNADGSLSYDPNGAFDTLTSSFTGASNTSAFDSFYYGLEGGGVATVLIQVNGLSSAEDRLQGNGFSNRLTGNDLDDMFFLQQGGNDQAFGGAGSDGFYFGSAFTPADTVDGGIGIDSLALQGNYPGLSLGSVNAVELLVLLSGSDRRFGDTAGNLYDYQVATTDGNVPAGGIFTVQAETLLAGEDLKFDGSAETDGHFRIFAGQGNDDLTGGAGNDGFLFGNGGNLDGNDRIHGGPGTDSVALRGNYVGADAVVFDNASLDSVEVLVFLSGLTREFGGTIFPAGFDYDVTMADGNVAAGQVMSVIAALLSANESVRFDGRAETDGAFRILSGAGDDVLLGSQQADTLYGGLGADQMDGQAGADVYVYRSTSESTAAAADRLTMDAADLIDLRTIDANVGAAGDQAFAFIGSGAFTGTAGQLRATFSGGLWTIEGDTNGDGVADLFIQATSPDPITGSEFLF